MSFTKSLYGLKQSGHNWHSTLTDFLKWKRFIPNTTDPCIYYCTRNDDDIIILFWVDDIFICSRTLALFSETNDMLCGDFETHGCRSTEMVPWDRFSDTGQWKLHNEPKSKL